MLIIATVGPPVSGHTLGVVLGRMLFPWLLATLITWLFLRRRHPAFWITALTALPSFTSLMILFTGIHTANRT
ncbi:hypothetical protein F4560_003214 [Saccharothrix ecbatanensis]|uniref:Uncharacterized protein n=1 Tax=Saccharothrix ecbatanensis TaxID=1105145 RepID=A0A7W9HJW7_9PSEU|nr:hypothetical protein [Saccharothrix ecbatanensis]MBB5803446.1 hypothetical protein [Saccharothrix ecbatanensis]